MITITNEDLNIEKIADSGQCFRLNREGDHWLNIAGGKTLRIYQEGDNVKLDCKTSDYNKLWKAYFDLDTDYSYFRNQIPKKDKYLEQAAEFGKGIRILVQDPWEMLITFIISQRKNIPAIKTSVESISKLFGTEIEEGIFAFPSPGKLASATESQLSGCSLGYRLPYVMSAAKDVDSGRLDLEAISKLSDTDLLDALMSVYGVGIKVANCVSLFAYHRIEAFPIDVWIARVLAEQYNNQFPFERYKGFGGVIQQYMFYYARTGK